MGGRALAVITILVFTAASLAGLVYTAHAFLGHLNSTVQPANAGSGGHRAMKADRLASIYDFSRSRSFQPTFSFKTSLTYPQGDYLTDTSAFTSSYAGFVPSQITFPLSKSQHVKAPSHQLLNDAQIAGIKFRLKLTPAQAEHWPEVEEALRDVARYQLQSRGRTNGAAPRIDVSSPEVQKLIAVSVPLINKLREGQKREVRALVRMIGLETIASNI